MAKVELSGDCRGTPSQLEDETAGLGDEIDEHRHGQEEGEEEVQVQLFPPRAEARVDIGRIVRQPQGRPDEDVAETSPALPECQTGDDRDQVPGVEVGGEEREEHERIDDAGLYNSSPSDSHGDG